MTVTQQVKDVLNVLRDYISTWSSTVRSVDKKLNQIIEAQIKQQLQLDTQTALLKKILAAVESPIAAGFVVVVRDDAGTILNPNGELNMDVKVGKQVTATIEKIVDKFGNDATLDGQPTWAMAGDAVKSITPSADGMSAAIVFGTVAKVTGQVTLTGDGDPGPDQALFHSTLEFSTIADSAVEFVVSVGAPTDPTA